MSGGSRSVGSSGRPVWIGTSWKMTKSLAEARDFVDRIAGVPVPAGVQPFVLPSHTALAAVRARLPATSPVLIGAQNAHWAPEGAWTGEVSMRMVADAGARMVEIGHSERREHFGETDQTVAAKAAAAIEHGLTPLICVGEPLSVREAGSEASFIADQVRAALQQVDPADVGRVLLAYEPIWAIGEAGRPATVDETAPVLRTIIDVVTARTGGGHLQALLYGGSVSVGNAEELLADPSTDGLFVGRAAWQPDGLLALIQIAASTVR